MNLWFQAIVVLVLGGSTRQFDLWDGTTEWEDGQLTTVKGWLNTTTSGEMYLCPGILINLATEANSCLDIVLKAQGERISDTASAVVLKGVFRRYTTKFRGNGNHISEVGVLDEAELVKVKANYAFKPTAGLALRSNRALAGRGGLMRR
jgi:hypothetical protein